LGLLEQQAFGDEHGHVDVLVAAFLEAAVELLLDALPDGEAVGADDHAAANRRVVNQLALENHVGIPLGEIHVARGDVLHEALLLFGVLCHDAPFLSSCGYKKQVPMLPAMATAMRWDEGSLRGTTRLKTLTRSSEKLGCADLFRRGVAPSAYFAAGSPGGGRRKECLRLW